MLYTLRIIKEGAAVLDGATLLDLANPLVQVDRTVSGVITVTVPDGVALGRIDPGAVIESQQTTGSPYIVQQVSAVSAGGPYPAGGSELVARVTPAAGSFQNSEVIQDLGDDAGFPAGSRRVFMAGHTLALTTTVAGPHTLSVLIKQGEDEDFEEGQVEGTPSSGGGGSGDVSGPGSSTDGNLASFDGTTGKLIEDSGIGATDVSAHLASTANPHSTDFSTLSGGTLGELNALVSDGTLDTDTDPRPPTAHEASHAAGGSDAIAVESLGTAELDTSLVLIPDGSGGLTFGSASSCVVFGGNITALNQNWRYGTGASTDAGDPAVSQLTTWVTTRDIVLENLVVTSFRTPSDGSAVIGVFLGASGTPLVSANMDTPVLLPGVGSYQVMSLGDTPVPAGSLVTIRQTAGQLLEFSSATPWYR